MRVDEIRKRFPMLQVLVHGHRIIYFDSAATAFKPQSVIDSMTDFYQSHYATVHRAIYSTAREATALYEGSREKIRQFLNAKSSEEILFTRGTTDAINLLALSLGDFLFEEGDEILLPETEHHSNIVPWQILAKKKNLLVRTIPVDEDGVILIEEFVRFLSKKTKLVSVAHVSNFTGALQPVEQLVKHTRQLGAVFVLDAAQSAPHLPIDVQALDIDFLAFSGHKLFGPTGVGILYGKKTWLEKMPPVQGGGDMIEKVSWDKVSFQEPPLKFEAGTPMIAEVIGLGAAVDFVESLGRAQIAHYEHKLLTSATAKLKTIAGLKIIGQASEKGAIISFVVEGCHSLDLGTLLDLDGIAIRTGHLCTQPAMKRFGIKEALRISFAPYNTLDEIDTFVEALKRTIRNLR